MSSLKERLLYIQNSKITEKMNNLIEQEKKFKKLYIAANELLAILGAEGAIISDDECADNLMNVLFDIDGGEYDCKKVFGIAKNQAVEQKKFREGI